MAKKKKVATERTEMCIMVITHKQWEFACGADMQQCITRKQEDQ